MVESLSEHKLGFRLTVVHLLIKKYFHALKENTQISTCNWNFSNHRVILDTIVGWLIVIHRRVVPWKTGIKFRTWLDNSVPCINHTPFLLRRHFTDVISLSSSSFYRLLLQIDPRIYRISNRCLKGKWLLKLILLVNQ